MSVMEPPQALRLHSDILELPEAFPSVNSRVMFTTHSRVMITSHRRTHVYHSAGCGGWVKSGYPGRIGTTSFLRFRCRKLSPRMVRV